MDLAHAIRTRRSVGAFTDQAVDPALVQELIDTAVWVPNHKMTEPWRFVFLSGEGVKRYASIRRDMALEGVPAQDEVTRRQAGEGTYQKFAIIPAYLGVIMKRAREPGNPRGRLRRLLLPDAEFPAAGVGARLGDKLEDLQARCAAACDA